MIAKQNGESSWNFETDGDQEQLEIKMDFIIGKMLEQMQETIKLLVDLRDTRRLIGLQECTNLLYGQADQAMSQGKKMTVTEQGD